MFDQRLGAQTLPIPVRTFSNMVGFRGDSSVMGMILAASLDEMAVDDMSGGWGNGPIRTPSLWLAAALQNPGYWGLWAIRAAPFNLTDGSRKATWGCNRDVTGAFSNPQQVMGNVPDFLHLLVGLEVGNRSRTMALSLSNPDALCVLFLCP